MFEDALVNAARQRFIRGLVTYPARIAQGAHNPIKAGSSHRRIGLSLMFIADSKLFCLATEAAHRNDESWTDALTNGLCRRVLASNILLRCKDWLDCKGRDESAERFRAPDSDGTQAFGESRGLRSGTTRTICSRSW